MDLTQIIAQLEIARTIVASHGIVAYMSESSRQRLNVPATNGTETLRFEFCLDPKKSSWDPGNSAISLDVDFKGGQRFEVDGDTLQRFKSRVNVSFSSGHVDIVTLKQRENMMSTVLMLMEMITATLPDEVTVIVATAQQKSDAEKKRISCEIGMTLGRFLDRDSTKGLRTGGKCRIVPFPQRYIDKYGAPPAEGVYPYKQVRRTDRYGDATAVVNYTLMVRVNYAGNQTIIINRV